MIVLPRRFLLNKNHKQILAYAQQHGRVGVNTTRAVCKCSERRARILLLELVNNRYLSVAVGGGFQLTMAGYVEVSL